MRRCPVCRKSKNDWCDCYSDAILIAEGRGSEPIEKIARRLAAVDVKFGVTIRDRNEDIDYWEYHRSYLSPDVFDWLKSEVTHRLEELVLRFGLSPLEKYHAEVELRSRVLDEMEVKPCR